MSYSKFYPINSADFTSDIRADAVLLEYKEVSITVASATATVEVPTEFDEVLGVFSTNGYTLTTDGVVTTGAVTVSVYDKIPIGDGAKTLKLFVHGICIATTVAEPAA
jgi:hypothetical protein